ncbi:MAG: hypothetical protein JWN79_2899 [Gemmatimonadetes bacterium]|jgi:hypothetical protein|nr:hypothetical protein [Gemmatimonadota bacterium]
MFVVAAPSWARLPALKTSAGRLNGIHNFRGVS